MCFVFDYFVCLHRFCQTLDNKEWELIVLIVVANLSDQCLLGHDQHLSFLLHSSVVDDFSLENVVLVKKFGCHNKFFLRPAFL